MYFMRIKNKVKQALIRFCLAQPNVGLNYSAHDVEIFVDKAFVTLNRFTGVKVAPVALEELALYADGKRIGKDLPDLAGNVGIISNSCILLGSLNAESTSDIIGGKQIARCYDLFYDDTYEEIRMIYRVEISDKDFTAIYRTEVYALEKFNLYDFIRAITLQIADMLEQNAPAKCRKKEAM